MIGELLKAYMKEHRWSVRKLAPRIGLSAATLNRIMRGKSMDQATMMKLMNWLFSKIKPMEGE